MESAAPEILHPLLHSNTSDLSEQRYSSTFTGEEFFLTDHRVPVNGQAGQKVLPGVAYLEMARAAIEQALPSQPESTVLELHHIVWAQPLVVADKKRIEIALAANDDHEIDFEIYSHEGDQARIFCQGRAVWGPESKPARLDLDQLKRQMEKGRVEPSSVYAKCAHLGLVYGPAFQGITSIHRGHGQVLAQLRLPSIVADTSRDYVLHPSLMDGGLQAAFGLIDGGPESNEPQLPFALDLLRIISPCCQEMVVWVRYAPDSRAADDVVRLDLDLCDEHGNIYVQLRGLSSRGLRKEVSDAQGQAIGPLLVVPVWRASSVEVSIEAAAAAYDEHQVILCELSGVNELEALLPQAHCISLCSDQQESIAQRYSDYALACFERIQTILKSKPGGRALVQIVVAEHEEKAVFAGLLGLLKTASLENPMLIGQLILVPAESSTEALARQLEEEVRCGKSGRLDTLVRYADGGRQVLSWQEVPEGEEKPPIAFKDGGVYLITGGLGGLGLLFTREILAQTREARVVLAGRPDPTPEKAALLDGLSAQTGSVSYRQVDVEDLEQAELLIEAIQEEYGKLDGILHSAGVIADSFILKKSSAQFRGVLSPKVIGIYNLDQASRHVKLDFFVFFSSLAGALGNLGQADYAAANGFLDQFAAQRNRQVAAGQRHGRTRSINWPLWEEGGMGVDSSTRELLRQTTGMRPMQTVTGMQAFYRSLELPYDQVLVVEGDLAQMRRALLASPKAEPRTVRRPVAAVEKDSDDMVAQTTEFLRRKFSELMKLPAHKIDPQVALEEYGIDSVLAMKLTNLLEETFGSLSKTLFFEYQTIAGMARYFVKAHPAVVRSIAQETSGLLQQAESKAKSADQITVEPRQPATSMRSKKRFLKNNQRDEIAIIGLAGRYPQAENLSEFWHNLQNGRDCITEIPPERWEHARYYDSDPDRPGKTYSKWGGFIADVDKFDPLFFNVSPKEAALIDPQERLFLETAWEAIEDAGYARESVSGSRVGVYVGVMWGHYELFGAESLLTGGTAIPISSHASIANRVSYFFDFRGPSIALDTMCSSSLTAIHLACEDLKHGEIEAAIAGGVNLTIHPYKYLSLSQGKFVASDGRCRSFGAGGDGYVPGEGVGAVLLKPLEAALRDGDHIYAVIKSCVLNHGGKTNGYTVPNPNAQADLVRDALNQAKIDPQTLSYIETHGTGTALGDPIEITGLMMAFEGAAETKQFCPIGSVKSNIGHLESAAGIASVTKALLQFKHEQLVPSLHVDPLNPNINFGDTPFYVQTRLTEWKRSTAHPRRIGVSSFGAGGSNAHLILEEYLYAQEPKLSSLPAPPEAFVLSARDSDALCRYAGKVEDFLAEVSELPLANIAYTSQVGRTPMNARLVILASSVKDLRGKLNQWINLQKSNDINDINDIRARGDVSELEDVFYGNIKESNQSARNLIEGSAGMAFLEGLLANRDLEKIARLWIMGVEINWSLMRRSMKPGRVSLPTYPFAKERCWVNQESPAPRVMPKSTADARRGPGRGRAGEKRRTHPVKPGINQSAPAEVVGSATLLARTEAYLKEMIGEEIKLSTDRIGSSDRFESFGIDSVMIARFNASLERDLGALPKTLFYEYETVAELAKFLLQVAQEPLVALFGPADWSAAPQSTEIEEEATQAVAPEPEDQEEAEELDNKAAPEPIAIIGIHGYYPRSANLHEFWENLQQGRDLIDVVPPKRWDYQELYDPDPTAASEGKIYCKWGGFLDDYDKFDPHFFNIHPEEAKIIDPQERLFLESVWAAIEDAGYTRESLKKRFPKAKSADVGVFVGVTTNSYHLWAPEEQSRGNFVCPGAMPWSIANRVSYFFDFNGPSLPVDTACSSSLVALHLASDSLRRGECQVAIAGGVNLYLHPSKYQSLCQGRMLSLDGKCRSYGAGASGFIPGEGVGTVVLKPLSKAIADQDRIYAVILSSGFDHSGRSHGYSAPNPNAQANLISRAFELARIHPETVGYVEGHGTGTQLGDSLEIAALTQAFRRWTTKSQFCAIGSIKANLGHSESAAGIASLAKVILQMKHQQLASSINSDEVNPDIEFSQSPFYLQHGLSEWVSSSPRRALINSFGAGGVNACLIVEEYRNAKIRQEARHAEPCVFTVSAKDGERLREYIDRLLVHIRSERDLDLASLCYTLQVGREAMDERIALVVENVDDLIGKLSEWSLKRSSSSTDIYRSSPGLRRGSTHSSKARQANAGELSPRDLASRWAAGEDVDWESLYNGAKPDRISLPTYPFARNRYWITDLPLPEKLSHSQLHPLISYNSSTLKDVSFSSSLTDTAFYAVDHQVHDEKVFPGAGFLEVACISGNIAGERRVRRIKDIVWIQPLVFRTGPQMIQTFLRDAGGDVEYSISSVGDDNEMIVHSEGRLSFNEDRMNALDAHAAERIPIQDLKARCTRQEEAGDLYTKLSEYGLHYGPSFRTIQEIHANGVFALTRLKISDNLKGEFGQFILHPSIIDGALQTIAALAGNAELTAPHLPFALDELEIFRPLPQACYVYAEHGDSHSRNGEGVRKFNLRILNESGDLLISFRNLYVRPLGESLMRGGSNSADTVHRAKRREGTQLTGS